MKYIIETEQYHVRVSYQRADGYKAKRAAILLSKQIEDAGDGAER